MFVFKFMECYFPAQNGDNSDNSDDSDNKNGAMAATAGSDSSDDSDDNDNKNGALPPAAIKKDTGHRRRNTPNGRCTYNMTTVPGAFLNRAFRVSDTQ